MFIDTHTKDSMENSICSILEITKDELNNFLITIQDKVQNGTTFYWDVFYELVDDFVNKHYNEQKIDEILFFHLSRRLNSANDELCSLPLIELLTTQNEFSNFLADHSITFEIVDNALEIFHCGQYKTLDKNDESYCNYLKGRLGHYQGSEDFCVNGFAFKDLLYKHHYTRDLSQVPEFIDQLAQFLDFRILGEDYYENSKYYCFEYLVPINEVKFDEAEKLNLDEKQVYLIKTIHWLYDYTRSGGRYISVDNNPILRLDDDVIMQDIYFQDKEEITIDMF